MKPFDSDLRQIKPVPDFSFEERLIASGYSHVAGIDEAGRGPLAGPVVVCAVVLDPLNIPKGLNDSKKLSGKRREELCTLIFKTAKVGIVSAPPSLIEKLNIRGATLWAMAKTLEALPLTPDYALFDGRDVPGRIICAGEAIVKGDSRSVSIAAASIVAKVTRDRMCETLNVWAPKYGFSSHKGYGTSQHMKALATFGATSHHRALFAPVAKSITETNNSKT